MRSKQDEFLLEYLASKTFIFLKYVGHKKKGTTLDIMLPPPKEVLYIPFVIDSKPVHIERVYRPNKK